ncbi:uncharacterized protein PF3D7_1120600-like [Mercenaria mercenaria]|uniref:uncharacterized protein PF3D7_1120600-like n=1 Tax=Mercenaria mercenaria TaxID=6596 RepID=UPI00234E6BA1|nr:uncharacterized protein PF3D7_1120600-like [Mercenaria mercenaria]
MEQSEKIRLDIIDKIRCRQMDNDFSSSDSEQETGSGNSFGTPRSGASDIGTPRSLTSEESSAVTSPRANLLWDHGFDVAEGERISPEGRDAEWKRFRNKTDDDKIIADKRLKIQEIAHQLQEINEREAKKAGDKHKTGQGLPDLIPLASVSSSVGSSQETLYAIDDLDIPPPLPDSDPPNINFADFPPPLPATSPPQLILKENVLNEMGESVELREYESQKHEDSAIERDDVDSDDTSELCNENPYGVGMASDESSSGAGDLSDRESDERETNFDGFYNVQTHTVFKMSGDGNRPLLPMEMTDDMEAEFDFILQSLDAGSESQETYIERFAGRRDRYGFILSPVVEAPSPTPSNMSGYSGYSGISCSSPDPFSVFRMSPGPIRGSKQEIDLSSLCVKSNEWDLGNEQTVPIYQTVQAKRALVVPEGYGWESGDDLLSPTGSVEWDCSDNGLSTPPVSTTYVNLTQFGTHITGWKQPDVAIYEEPENYDSDSTIEDENTSDTDTTIDEDSPRDNFGDASNVVVKECSSPEKNLYNLNDDYVDKNNTDPENNDESNEFMHNTDESVQTLELSVLEEEINKVENELKLLKMHTGRNYNMIENEEQELGEIKPDVTDLMNENDVNADTVSLESSLDDSFRGFSAELADINQSEENKVASQKSLTDEGMVSVNSSLNKRCRNPIPVPQKHTQSTSDDESDTTENYEDAEDEYSDSDSENDKEDNKESDFELFKARPVESNENSKIDDSSTDDKDGVLVTELLTPRSAILKSGGMFPEDTESSSLTSDEDAQDANMSSYGSGIKVSQYTSGDSDDNGVRMPKTDNMTEEYQKSTTPQDNVANKEEQFSQITIQSPLDLSILDSRIEASNRVDLRKSPRIFGRYYAEMDDELLEEVRSKCDSIETPRSEPELPESLTENARKSSASYGQGTTTDLDEFENSFQHVEISNSSDVKCEKEQSGQQTGIYGKLKQTLSHDKSINGEENVQNFRKEAENVTTNAISNMPSNFVETHEIYRSHTPDLKPEEHFEDGLKKSKLSLQTSHRSDTLKIKISHLTRRDSVGSKIKHGYVHELSELFDKSVMEHKSDVVINKVKCKRRDRTERPQTPKVFTPNENIVIYENNAAPQSTDENDQLKGESLGFEVTPLQRVESFEHLPEVENEDRMSEDELSDIENLYLSVNEDSFEDSDTGSDAELKMYENQLRKREDNIEVYNNDSKGEATILEDDESDECSGTTEFVPKLETSAEIYTLEHGEQGNLAKSGKSDLRIAHKALDNGSKTVKKENPDEQKEIEENIDGDTDSNQSEDEEFHDRYFLPGHVYHISDPGNNNSYPKSDTRTNEDTDINSTKNEFVRPPDEIIIEDAVIEVSSDRRMLDEHENEASSERNYEKCQIRNKGDLRANSSVSRAIIEHTDDRHEGDRENKREDSVSEKLKHEHSKVSSSQHSHIDMSGILWNIPWKSLKGRKPGEVTDKSQRSNEAPRNPSGYMYDIISRINTEPKSKTQSRTHLSNRPVIEQNEKEISSDNSELKVQIIEKNEKSEKQNMTPKYDARLSISEGINKTAISEKGEFDFVENISAETLAREGNMKIISDCVPRKRHVYDYDEDPRFKIRYPSSLSRRLYGPYCRLRSKNETVYQREINPPGLTSAADNDMSRVSNGLNMTGSPISSLLINNENSRTNIQQVSKFYTEEEGAPDKDLSLSPVTCDPSCTDFPIDNSSIHSDDHSSNPNDFNHTCYAVKTPFSSLAQRGGIKFNLKAIIGGERNQAHQNTPLSENNFVNVKLQHGGDEAKSDKQECNFKTSSHYGNGNYDVKFTELPMYLECKSLNNKCGQENRGEINNNNLGVDANTVAVKNDDHYTVQGVHIPSELSANETKRENVDMNNDSASTSHKINCVETNIPGINSISASVTTQNINSHPMSSGDVVTDDKAVNNETKKSPEDGETHISRASVVLQTPGFQHVLEDEKGKLRIWPYSDFDNSDKLPVTLHRVKKRINLPDIKGMSSRSSNMTVIQSAEHSAEMPENRVVQKYHSSSILPGDRTAGQMMKAHGESVQSVLLQDSNGNNVSEEELAAVLPKIANSISKMETSNAEEILPGITQSITKLKNGGNLVITTMTRKLDEEENSSSGRGSPEPEPDYPVLNVDDLENSKIYLVQDSKGELFYVEDVTSETQESAYFSSRNTSESVSDTGNSPTFDRISKINSVGDSGIKQSTAQEILTAMYGDSDVKELTENEEEWSERTYEYEIPRRRDSGTRKEYSKDSFNTSYMVEEPGDTLPKLKSATTKDRYESSYQMSGGAPWVYDGGMSQRYSQVTQGVCADDTNSVSAVSAQNVDNSTVKTIERYTIEGEAIDYPAPQPMFIPPMVVHSDIPQYSLVKVDVTPKHKDEGVMARIEAPKPEEPIERPIYKTVATITTPEKVPSPKPVEKKKYKIIASKATERQEEEQETHMRFDEIDYKFSAENVEYRMRPATTETQYFIKNTSNIQPHTQFRSEKRIELGKNSDQKYKSQIQVQEPKPEVYEQSSYSYDQMKSELEQSESNMRVVRGSYLIKNTLDNADVEFDDNINMFDGNFNMYKDNPLYKSDEDLYKRLERERIENARRQERMQRDLNQDISFETVDRFTKSKTVKREPEKPRQSLYELLMSRLSTIDSKHIRQTIDVKHDHEDIYGDPRFLQADGEYLRNIAGTNNFETVGEKVDLMLKEGKAFITVKVTAERITPIDLEFNVWRKNQAIVTRTIEVDLLATERRRQLYYKVMEEPATGSRGGYRAGPNETVLDSKETLELFTKILGAADGEGDTEDIEVKTRLGKTTNPFSSGMDLLY